MHLVSDGQRRRVQLFLGLIQPFKILLMDEVTISLDALIRYNILKWIKQGLKYNNFSSKSNLSCLPTFFQDSKAIFAAFTALSLSLKYGKNKIISK